MKTTSTLAIFALGSRYRKGAARLAWTYTAGVALRRYWNVALWFIAALYVVPLFDGALLWALAACLPVLLVKQLWELRLTARASVAASGGAGRRAWWDAMRQASADMARDWYRLRRLRRRWAKACESSAVNLLVKGGGAPELRRVRADGTDVRASVSAGRVGIPVSSIQKRAPELAEIMGARDLTVRPVRDRAELTFHFGDTLSTVMRQADLPRVPAWAGESVPRLRYGIDSSGNPQSISLYTSVLIGGMSGSGKSSVIWSLLQDAIYQRVPVRLRVLDPAGGVEFAELGANLGYTGEDPKPFRVHRYISSPKEAERMFQEMQEAMQARMRNMPAGVRQHYGTVEEPYDIALVDELLLVDSMRKKGSAAEDILTVGRKAGFLIIACTQDATVETVGPLRRLFPQRLCFATMNRDATEVILGGGAATEAPAHKIPKSTPGVGYAYDEFTRGYSRFRAIHVPDNDTRLIAKGQLPKSVAPAGEQVCYVYRFWTWDEQLLYIGKALDPGRRLAEHLADKAWAHEIVRVELTRYPSEAAALAAEREAIIKENPRENVVHSRRPRRKAVAA